MAKKVLVIDDEASLAEIVNDQVEILGYESRFFTSSLAAQNYLRENPVDLVVTDIRMPELTGEKLFEWIQKELKPAPKVIFITGYAEMDQPRAIHLGAVDLLNKPFKLKELEKLIFQAIGKA